MRQVDNLMANISGDNEVHLLLKISEGMNFLLHHQKCIKLANSSEQGWRVVQEYERKIPPVKRKSTRRKFRQTAKFVRSVVYDSRHFTPYITTKKSSNAEIGNQVYALSVGNQDIGGESVVWRCRRIRMAMHRFKFGTVHRGSGAENRRFRHFFYRFHMEDGRINSKK